MKLSVVDLGRMAYRSALQLQTDMVQERIAGTIHDTLILVEHDPVYTLGRRATPAHILIPEAELNKQGIELCETGRGGDVTYHGPGQITGYPILSLKPMGLGVLAYVEALEQILMATCSAFGVQSRTDSVNRGVWIEREKVAAIGIRVTKHVTMHGFALNACVNLDHYRGIVPCGLPDRGVTSLDRFCPEITPDAVKPVLIEQFRKSLGYE